MQLGRRAVAVTLGTLLMSASPVFAAPKIESVPGEYVVRLKRKNFNLLANKSLNQTNQKRFLERLSLNLNAQIIETIPSQNIVVVKRPTIELTKSAVKSLALNPMVEIAEPNFIYRINKTPNDPMFGQLWGLKNVGQKDSEGVVGVNGIDIDAERAWEITTGSKEKIIAIIDTGVDFNHPDLKENLWINEAEANGKAGVDDDGNGVVDDIHGYNAINGSGNAMDDQGHGSHCAGTIGARGDDGIGVAGINWNTRIMAVKFLSAEGSGTLSDAIKAIDYATKMGALIMSNSWGGGGYSQALFESIQRSNDAGALFIAAAGNDYSNNDDIPSYPATYDVKNIISVAAIDNNGRKADFSNFGKRTVHLGAPGVNILSSTGGAYQSWSGTSMATPHVSGVAGLVWSHEPNLTAAELKQRLLATSVPVAGLRGKTKTGAMLNAFNALTNAVAPPDANDPANWNTIPADYKSASPYSENLNETYEVTAAGAKEFALYFEKFDTEASYDTLTIYDSKGAVVQTLSGKYDDSFSAVISGDSAKLVFKSDDNLQKEGWKITKMAIR